MASGMRRHWSAGEEDGKRSPASPGQNDQQHLRPTSSWRAAEASPATTASVRWIDQEPQLALGEIGEGPDAAEGNGDVRRR